MVAAQTEIVKVVKQTGGGGLSIFKHFYLKIVIFFLLIILINAIVLGIQQGSVDAGISYLALKLLTPTLSLSQESLKILSNQGIYVSVPNDPLKTTLAAIGGYWAIISAVFSILLWVGLFAKIIAHSPISNTSATFANWLVAILLFLGIQTLYIAWCPTLSVPFTCGGEVSMTTPWKALFYDFVRAIPYIISPAVSLADSVIGETDSIQPNITNGTPTA